MVPHCVTQLRCRSHLNTNIRLGRYFEDDDAAVFAAHGGRAVEVPLAVDDEARGGLVAVGGYEGLQPGVFPFAVGAGCQFEYHATAALGGAAKGSRAANIDC